MPRRATKIVATLGPASSDPALLEKMIRAGVNVVRLNFSHGTAQDHVDRAQLVREAAQRAGREVAIMADLQGPKIRVGKFAEGKVQLEPGEKFILDASRPTVQVSATFPYSTPPAIAGGTVPLVGPLPENTPIMLGISLQIQNSFQANSIDQLVAVVERIRSVELTDVSRMTDQSRLLTPPMQLETRRFHHELRRRLRIQVQHHLMRYTRTG